MLNRSIFLLRNFKLFNHIQNYSTSLVLSKSRPNWGTKKHSKFFEEQARLQLEMSSGVDENILQPLRASVKEQGDIVRTLKSEKAPAIDIQRAVAELKHRKKILDEKENAMLASMEAPFDRPRMEDLLKRRFFYDLSFAIYGGVQGLYDYGPMGCAIKTNLINLWRRHFVLEEQMLEVDCSVLTPEPVLKASGHVERFSDWMVKDLKTGECFRADHLVQSNLEKYVLDKKSPEDMKEKARKILITIDDLDRDGLMAALLEFEMKSPITGNDLSDPMEFNLMFPTSIGPTGQIKGFLRPETAQGIFVNFKRLLEFNQRKLPFAVAQIGSAYRNEISPRSGLIRVREFTMAEIEHFVEPDKKTHPKFNNIKDIGVMMYSACNQMDGVPGKIVTFGEAVANKVIANETLAYFMARIYLFLKIAGVDEGKMRFRQHLGNEMAHYACDCWDAELKTSYGWVECVGCADRSAYDLTSHMKGSGQSLKAERTLPEPITVENVEAVINKGLIGKTFRKDSKDIVKTVDSLNKEELEKLSQSLDSSGAITVNVNGKDFTLDKSLIEIKRTSKTTHVEEFVPSVIEPSFGVGRVLYSLLEHNFKQREGDEQRNYFSLPPSIAPIKCSVLPLSKDEDLNSFVKIISEELTELEISNRVDDSSGSIGRRYARTDEVGIPFGITVDFDTVKNNPASVTVRDRDSMQQIRVSVEDVATVVWKLVKGKLMWSQATEKYPVFEQQESVTKKIEDMKV